MRAPISPKVAKLLENRETARKLATAIRDAKAKDLPRATVYLDESEQRAAGITAADLSASSK